MTKYTYFKIVVLMAILTAIFVFTTKSSKTEFVATPSSNIIATKPEAVSVSQTKYVSLKTMGSATRHPDGFIGKNIKVSGYLLKQEKGYGIFSDEINGTVGYYDLPISGSGVDATKTKQKYNFQGKFVRQSIKSSNGSPFLLELSAPPQVTQ